jgi:hypothetical protein
MYYLYICMWNPVSLFEIVVNGSMYDDHLQSSWTHHITLSWNFVELR